ncbi:MAG: 3-phosphoserine/phosphohydroxythreonine transaminase [Bacteroidales bacterium]|nr:3-phosphoserine/phosphohydroxythreonine transaminase [Bacteroidales bacterium]
MRKHIFNAGPCVLADVVRENTAKAVIELGNSGQSIMEVSHRSKDFEPIIKEAADLLKEILNIPEGYSVLFLGGGASLQFAMVPFNFLNTKAAYLNTGTWASGAIKEARLFGEVQVLASSEDKNFNYYPKGYTIPTDVDYFHITTNNTIYGTEILRDIDSPVPLIADMSSDILSRPVDVSKYDLIYAGAQKNMGPAGVTVVIIKNEFLERVTRTNIPTMLKYRVHVENGSMKNTPPCTAIFTVREVLRWVKSIGGVREMDRRAQAKADLLYHAIDSSKLFVGTVAKEDRSRMNICFVMKEGYKDKEADFIAFAGTKGVIGIKGHRSVGGFRASCYNALDIASVQVLVDAMAEYEKSIL